MALLIAAVCLQAGTAQPNERINIGFSRSIVGEVNENDILAAIKAWATELMVAENYFVNVQPQIYGDVRDIQTALKQARTDFICFTTTEFVALQHLLNREKLIFSVSGGSMTEEYLLLTPKKSPIAEIKDLKGRSLIYSKNSRSALSVTWLDIELARSGLPTAANFFKRMEPVGKVSDALLPVFFGKKNACLVTRKGFEIMAELNPQISRQLKVLAASKEYIPGILAFRKSYQSKIKEIVLNRIEIWDQTPAGRQIFTIFQTDMLVIKPFEILGPTMELIKEHRHLFGADTGTFRPKSKAKVARP